MEHHGVAEEEHWEKREPGMDLGARHFCRHVASPHQPAWMVLAWGIAFLRSWFQRLVTAFSSIIFLFSISSGLQ